MTNEVLFLAGWISFLLIGLLAVAIIIAVISAGIMFYLPNSRLADWLEDFWFDKEDTKDEIWNHKAGECCKPELQKAISYLESLPSPRITEQELRELLNAAMLHFHPSQSYELRIELWLDYQGRDMLNKLNKV